MNFFFVSKTSPVCLALVLAYSFCRQTARHARELPSTENFSRCNHCITYFRISARKLPRFLSTCQCIQYLWHNIAHVLKVGAVMLKRTHNDSRDNNMLHLYTIFMKRYRVNLVLVSQVPSLRTLWHYYPHGVTLAIL